MMSTLKLCHHYLTITMLAIAMLACFLFLPNIVLAEDIANRRIIGFSPDGTYFAFEEFGRQTRNHYPYANLFVINTRQNKWVKGSPFRSVIRKKTATRLQARREAERRAEKMLSRFRIGRRNVRTLASNPITELKAPVREITVNPKVSIRSVTNPITFSISEHRLFESRCNRLTSKPIVGLEISVQRRGGKRKVLHRDKRIPRSRGCPIRYAISDIVQQPQKKGKGAVYAIIYSVIRAGKSGLERRFIAGGWHDDGGWKDPDYYQEKQDYSDFDNPYRYRKRDWPAKDNEEVDLKALREAYESPLDGSSR